MKVTGIPKSKVYEKIDAKSINNNNMDTNVTYGEYLDEQKYIYYYSQSWRNKWEDIKENTHKAIIVPLTSEEINILVEAGRIGIVTLKRPSLFEEELIALEEKINEKITSTEGLFVRINQCSTKDGMYGVNPVFTAREIVNGIITSHRCFYNLKNYTENNIFIVPWDKNWHENGHEWRVFCFKGKITAISQHNLLSIYSLSLEDCETLIPKITKFCQSVISSMREKVPENEGNWVIDVVSFSKEKNIELVELNTFGAELPAGSALFDWNKDYEQLYGKTDFIEMRITK